MLEKSSLDNSTYIVEIVQGFGADRYGFWFADIYSITMSTSLMFVSPSQTDFSNGKRCSACQSWFLVLWRQVWPVPCQWLYPCNRWYSRPGPTVVWGERMRVFSALLLSHNRCKGFSRYNLRRTCHLLTNVSVISPWDGNISTYSSVLEQFSWFQLQQIFSAHTCAHRNSNR